MAEEFWDTSLKTRWKMALAKRTERCQRNVASATHEHRSGERENLSVPLIRASPERLRFCLSKATDPLREGQRWKVQANQGFDIIMEHLGVCGRNNIPKRALSYTVSPWEGR
ncbi:hypothetical protein ACEPPN_011107 [Leptodophora sp. 'Broadleaf-Isolate-01']